MSELIPTLRGSLKPWARWSEPARWRQGELIRVTLLRVST